jgi:hypothetical protein
MYASRGVLVGEDKSDILTDAQLSVGASTLTGSTTRTRAINLSSDTSVGRQTRILSVKSERASAQSDAGDSGTSRHHISGFRHGLGVEDAIQIVV